MIRKEKLSEIESYVNEIKTISHERMHDKKSKFLKVEVYNCHLNNGRIIPREKLIKGGGNGSAVIIVPRLENGEYLTIVEPRVFTKKTVGVGFPAGYIEKGETPLDAAIRELREETGYTIKDKNDAILLDEFYQDEGVSSAYNYIYLFNNSFKAYEQDLDENEIVKYITLNLKELEHLESLGYIAGGNTKLALRKLNNV